MALRKRSYRKGEILSTFLHNSKVKTHKDRLERDAKDKRRSREQSRQERALAEDERNEHKRKSKEQTLQRRELARKKQKQDDIAARLRSEEIDARWVGEAMLIMDEYGYGLGQVRSRVVPLLRPRIEQLLVEEEKQNAASQVLREQRRLEREKEQAASDAIEQEKRLEQQRIDDASNALGEAWSRLSQAIVLQAEALTQELDRLGKRATFGHAQRYLGSLKDPMIVVERPSNAVGRLLSSAVLAVLLIFLLLVAILVAINQLPPQYRLIGGAAGIVTLVVGSIWIIRKRRAKFLTKTASKISLSNEVALSCLTRMLPQETLSIMRKHPDVAGFGLFSDRSSKHYAEMDFPHHESVGLLRDKLLGLRRFGSKVSSRDVYSSDELQRHGSLNREITTLTSGNVPAQDGSNG